MQLVKNREVELVQTQPTLVTEQTEYKPFIEANTIKLELAELNSTHTVPVFTKDNTPLISQAQILNSTQAVLGECIGIEYGLPDIRLSHPIKGRVPTAIHKKTSDLLPEERTVYYERMIWVNKIYNFVKTINDQELTFMIGGIVNYGWNNLNKTYSAQRMKIFRGFQVKVCSNACIWTDDSCKEILIESPDTFEVALHDLLDDFDPGSQLEAMSDLNNYHLTERQFAQIIGRARLYNHLPVSGRKSIPNLEISDSQISTVVKNYYKDENFGVNNGQISLWDLYNLFTDSVKSSYIDSFVDRNMNAAEFTLGIKECLDNKSHNWFMN